MATVRFTLFSTDEELVDLWRENFAALVPADVRRARRRGAAREGGDAARGRDGARWDGRAYDLGQGRAA